MRVSFEVFEIKQKRSLVLHQRRKSYSIDRLALTIFDANTALTNLSCGAQDTTCKGIAVPITIWATSPNLYSASHHNRIDTGILSRALWE